MMIFYFASANFVVWVYVSVRRYAEALPVTYFLYLFRGLVLKDVALAEMSRDLIWLAGFTVIGLALAALRFKKSLD